MATARCGVSAGSLEYERDLRDGVHLLARATLEGDGVRFRYEVTNNSRVAYEILYAPTDRRLTSIFHDERLERTYVHHADGFDLLASETPRRLTIPLDQWLPARYLASFTWPIPAQRIERRDDGIPYYNKSRAVDMPFIATLSTDKAWVIASFARTAGNVWSTLESTRQHVDSQTSLSPGQRATIELKMLVIRGSLDDALGRAIVKTRVVEIARTCSIIQHRLSSKGLGREPGSQASGEDPLEPDWNSSTNVLQQCAARRLDLRRSPHAGRRDPS